MLNNARSSMARKATAVITNIKCASSPTEKWHSGRSFAFCRLLEIAEFCHLIFLVRRDVIFNVI